MKFKLIIGFFLLSIVSFGQSFTGFYSFEFTDEGEIHLQVPDHSLHEEFLYVNSLAAGIGSNDIGLDRGQLGDERIVKFIKAGNKLLLVQPNQRYRAISDNELEVKAVEEAFAQSVLGGFKIKSSMNGNHVIDLTSFLLRDAHGVSKRLSDSKQGSYRLAADKSAIWIDRTKSFPNNSEFEALLTFEGEPKGKFIRSVVPSPEQISVRQHHSFIKLPDSNYEPRIFHPFSGYGFTSFADYATPIESPIQKRYINRHRLEKKNPDAAISEAVEPIIYYIDSGCPEPVKSALMEGASWWDQAYQAAGFAKGTFQVKELPEGADPLDVRYNMIQWVHRSTRGWSYGASVRDPRTGEIIKGHVSLGSLRVRQDFLIAQGLFSPYKEGDDNHGPMLELALQRLRQLSAHEVGHTIGLAHNFASSYNKRASVMDYPHPLIKEKDNKLHIEKAYDDKIGAWDKFVIRYGYSDFPDRVSESEALQDLIDEAKLKDLRFMSDSDARPAGGAHPLGHLWDNGTDIIEELHRMNDLRSNALQRFGTHTITTGTPYSELEKALVPLYYMHRYQAEAVSKLIGGVSYDYNVKGDANHKVAPVSEDRQKLALDALLGTLSSDYLKIPQHILDLIPPSAFGYRRDRESFNSKSGLSFDPLAGAESYTHYLLGFLLHPERLTRLDQQNAIYGHSMSLRNYFSTIHNRIKSRGTGYDQKIKQAQEVNFVVHLLKLGLDHKIDHAVKSEALHFVSTQFAKGGNALQNAHQYNLQTIVQQALDRPEDYEWPVFSKMPPGSPIGCFME